MAKPWLEVEQSEDFQLLSPQQKVMAKREYWDSVVSHKSQYITLDRDNQEKAKNEFFGGRLVSDIPEKNFSRKNILLDTATGTVKDLSNSLIGVPTNITRGLVSMVSHPIQSAKAIGGTVVGAVQKAIPGEQKQEIYFNAITEAVKEKYGNQDVVDERTGMNVPAWAKTISSDPFGFILDISTIAGGSGASLKSLGRASKIKSLEKAGEFQTVGRVIKRVSETDLYKEMFPSRISKTDKIIDVGMIKAIRPSVIGKRDISQINKYKNNQRLAVKTIIENKENLKFTDDFGESVSRLPQNLEEFASSIHQTKSRIYKYYDDLLTRAGEQKGIVDLSKTSNRLNEVINNKTIQIHDPSVIKYAQDVQNRLKSVGRLSVKETDELIKSYNNSLQAFYKNPTYDSATRAAVDAMIANNLRSSLDDIVSGITGKQFQVIKNKYGALKAIERDVSQRVIVSGRQNIKGLPDFTDIFSAGDITRGLYTLDPSLFMKGIVQMSVKNRIKQLNNPNNIIKKMFNDAAKFHDPIAEVITPEVLRSMPINMQKAIMFNNRKELPLLGKSKDIKFLPSPRDVPYIRTGKRIIPRKEGIISPYIKGRGKIILGYKSLNP